MAKSNSQKLERLQKLSVSFNDVSEAITDIITNDAPTLKGHINTVKNALISSGHGDSKALKSAREMIFCLRDNKETYRSKYIKNVIA